MPAAGLARRWSAETRTGLVRRARRMNRTLARAFPHVYCELDFRSPLELAVATILSAQSTDKRVNLTTPALFARYPTARDYAQADRVELEEMIRSTGFYRNKATSLIGLGQALVERFDGEVPATMDELPMSSWETHSIFPESPSTPTSGDWRGGGVGRSRKIPSRWSTRLVT